MNDSIGFLSIQSFTYGSHVGRRTVLWACSPARAGVQRALAERLGFGRGTLD